jgi:hypothetical protein
LHYGLVIHFRSASDLQGVIVAIGKLRGSRGLSGQLKEFFKARSITDKIAGYQRRIQAKCETLKVGTKIYKRRIY